MLYDFCCLYLLCSAPLEPRGLILLSVVTKVCKSTLLANLSAGEKLPLKVFLYFCSLSAHRQVKTKPLLIGNFSIAVRAIPTTLLKDDINLILSEIADSLQKSGRVQVEVEEDLFHTVACKAAIKAGSKISNTEMLDLAQKVLWSKDIMYCPHGRPVAFEIKKRELEKMFGRIQ